MRRKEHEYFQRQGDKVNQRTEEGMASALSMMHGAKYDPDYPKESREEVALKKDLEWVNGAETRSEFVKRGQAVRKKWDKLMEAYRADYDYPTWNNPYEEFARCLDREESDHKRAGELSREFGSDPSGRHVARQETNRPSALQSARESGTIQAGNSAYNPAAFKKTKPDQFRQTFHAAKAGVAKASPEDAWRVDSSYTDDDYADMDCYTTEGGSAVAVHNGDIVSVCHNPGDSSRGSHLLKFAVEHGGKKLDAFGKLYGFYIKNGFEPVSWCEFDEEYAPPDWVKGRDRPEPVIFFRYTGRPYNEIVSDFGDSHEAFTRRVKASPDYGAAQEERDKTLRG